MDSIESWYSETGGLLYDEPKANTWHPLIWICHERGSCHPLTTAVHKWNYKSEETLSLITSGLWISLLRPTRPYISQSRHDGSGNLRHTWPVDFLCSAGTSHVQPLLRSLHWLRVPERISFQLAVLVYRCLRGSSPGYLASDLQRVSDVDARRRLHSSSTSALVGSRTLCATIGDRAFPAAAASVWNSLSESVQTEDRAFFSLIQLFRLVLSTNASTIMWLFFNCYVSLQS